MSISKVCLGVVALFHLHFIGIGTCYTVRRIRPFMTRCRTYV